MYFMLFCILVVTLSEAKQQYVPLPPELISLMLEKSPACVKETGADANVLQQFFTIPLNKDETSKKYNYCLFKSMGLSDDAGHFYEDKVLALYKNSEQKNILRIAKATMECNKIVTQDPVETMDQALHCFSLRAPAWIPYSS